MKGAKERNGDGTEREMGAGSKLIDVFNFSNSTLGHVGFVSGEPVAGAVGAAGKEATPLAKSF